MTNSASFGRWDQTIWGAIGGLTPYAVVGLKVVGFNTNFTLPNFSSAFLGALALSASLGVMGSILLESHTRFTAWFHGGSFPIMLNFLFAEAVHQVGTSAHP